MITIVCPVYNEEKYIDCCIRSIFSSDYPIEKMEILFVDGMSSDKTRKIILQYASQYRQIRLLNNPERIVPIALNIGIQEAKGDIVFRLDAHAIYPSNYFSVLVRYLEELCADNVGGICRTLPINNTAISISIACALSSPFGMGNSYFRIGTKNVRAVDTVPFGCFKKDIFEKVGFFDEELIRNQDDEFNGRIIKSGGRIYLIPEIVIDYFARDSIQKVAKMFYQYGLFKPLVNKKLGSPATKRQFFPLLFLLGLVSGVFLSCFSNVILVIYCLSLVLYFSLSLYFSAKEAFLRKDWKLIVLLPLVFFIIHVSYGWGYLKGCYKVFLNKKIVVEINR